MRGRARANRVVTTGTAGDVVANDPSPSSTPLVGLPALGPVGLVLLAVAIAAAARCLRVIR